VTYYARPKAPPPSDFTYVTIPDTQHYVDNTSFPVSFTIQTNWIVAHRDLLNIAFVSHLGEWPSIRTRSSSNGSGPIRACRSWTPTASLRRVARQPRSEQRGVANFFDQYFPVTRFLGLPWYGGYLGAEASDPINRLNKNNYELFSAGGMDFLVIHIEMDWPDLRRGLGGQDHQAVSEPPRHSQHASRS
jgi:hypothetical protein